ncbi:hypothetical protein VPH35_140206 [Triticum aestivum]
MCMSIFTSLANADKSKKPEPRKGFSKLTVSEAERAFSGNMCRCTGYRPIVDACKSFASDVDLEDLGLNIFWKKGDKDADVSKLPAYTLGGGVCTFPDFLKSEIKSSLLHLTDVSDVTVSRVGWYHPKSIGQYYDLLNSGIFSDCTVKVVVGNTSSGVKGYKDRDLYNKYIDIGDIPELSAVWKKDSGFEIGAATPISKTIEILEQEARSTSCANGSVVFRKLAEHMSKVATPFVRNTASLGGNIILAQKYPFPSDIATILLGAASTVRLQVYSETLEVTFEEFLEQPPLDPSTLLLSIFIPHWASDSQKEREAVYVDDIPAPKNCLYGEFIYSTQPLAYVKNIKFKPSLASEKILTVVSANDIPSGGQNIGSSLMFGDEPLFGAPIVAYAGQALGVVIAETQRYANLAGKQVVVEYDTKDLKPPIFTVEQAVQNNSYFEVPPEMYPKQVGNFCKGMAEADHKILSTKVKLASQYYFYMETQATLAIPDEDNSMVVYISSQYPEVAQSAIAKCLGIPFSSVRVITRRVGGGFGGKAFRSCNVATAAALCAFKLPVRMYLNRSTDMIMIWGRHPIKAYYSVGLKSDGRITALHLDILVNAGISPDASTIMPDTIISGLKKYNWGALSFDIKLCKTNNTSKSVMRAPGDAQGSFIAEAIIEHVASVLSLDANSVRQKNFHTYDSLVLFYPESTGEASTYTLHSIFDRLLTTSSYLHRAESIRQYNSCTKWWKRGISCAPLVFKVAPRPAPRRVSVLNDGSIVVEVGGIEIGQGLWTKVQQMTTFALGQLWPDGCESLLDRVRVPQADMLNLIQGGLTAGSTSSESSCAATLEACNMLVDRLKPVMEKLKQQSGGAVSWDALIAQTVKDNVNLSSSTYWVPGQESSTYLNYGAGISEVEIDLLTGTITLLRSDLVYDCGKSLNPAVDLGQIEGSFIQGVGFFINEEHETNADGLVVSDSTWVYKIPSVDTIPKQFNAEVLNTGYHKNRVLSSKAYGEPALVLAASVHCAVREAIQAARKEFGSSGLTFQFDVPASMTCVKEMCALDIVDEYLESLSKHQSRAAA